VGNSGFYLKEIRGLAVVLIGTMSSAYRGEEDAGRGHVSLSKCP